jgi:hypothetical protein
MNGMAMDAKRTSNGFETLPGDLLVSTFEFLETKEIRQVCTLTCHHWNRQVQFHCHIPRYLESLPYADFSRVWAANDSFVYVQSGDYILAHSRDKRSTKRYVSKSARDFWTTSPTGEVCRVSPYAGQSRTSWTGSTYSAWIMDSCDPEHILNTYLPNWMSTPHSIVLAAHATEKSIWFLSHEELIMSASPHLVLHRISRTGLPLQRQRLPLSCPSSKGNMPRYSMVIQREDTLHLACDKNRIVTMSLLPSANPSAYLICTTRDRKLPVQEALRGCVALPRRETSVLYVGISRTYLYFFDEHILLLERIWLPPIAPDRLFFTIPPQTDRLDVYRSGSREIRVFQMDLPKPHGPTPEGSAKRKMLPL